MSSSRSKVIAILSATLIAGGVMIAIRAPRGHDPRSSGNGAPSGPVTKPDTRAASLPAPGLEEWSQKIAGTDLRDFGSLMDEAMKIGDEELRNKVIVGIVDRWMLEDVDAFNKYIASLEVKGPPLHLAAVMGALQESLTKLDPDRGASDEIFVTLQRLISYLANHDPEKALVWSKKYLLDDTLESSLLAVARGMARTDVDRSLAVIAEIKSPFRRSQALATVGAIWAARDPEAALEWAGDLPYLSERALTLNSVLMAIAQKNPKGAASALQEETKIIAEAYAKERAERLAASGKTEADYANDPDSYNEAVESGVITPPTSPDLELLENAAKLIAEKIAGGDPAGAIALAESLPGDYLKLKTITGVLEGWAKSDPEAAFGYANKNYPDNTDLIKSLYGSWAAKDWTSAADGVSLIADRVKRSSALEAVITSAAVGNNAADIFNYVNKLPPSVSTDGVKYAAATAICEHSPQMAWEIARGISAGSAQYRALKGAFAYLVIANPDQAENLLTSANLSSDTSQKLKDMLDAVVGN
ncbi:hypothetical protein JIN84_10695 [Luteolibacter yonseiensis]|uniref:Uncharacterized protein n=1 Tax=Luteolibacter yonseiensis TaxID=1144680 RepID=A0A934VBF1_9BACT|nr:hypothetical protein [Luteolibacter yonseiensis]MBK1816080.1 hypothetical protein [Luteolibacter yonseiensis]